MKEFRNNTYFVLYDVQDYPICYFDNLEEVLKCINYSPSKLLYRFKNEGFLIGVTLGNHYYRLARFTD